MYELDNYSDHKDIEGRIFAVMNTTVFETEQEWKEYHRKNREEFLQRMNPTGLRVQIGGMESFVSPIDGKTISNSDDLSAHNRAHDVYQIGDEYNKNDKANMKLKREEFLDTHSEKDIV